MSTPLTFDRLLDTFEHVLAAITANPDMRFTTSVYPGIAVYVVGPPTKWVPCTYLDENDVECEDPFEGEWLPDLDSDRVRVIMVGDDREHLVDIDTLRILPEDGYCGSCGQVGCGHG